VREGERGRERERVIERVRKRGREMMPERKREKENSQHTLGRLRRGVIWGQRAPFDKRKRMTEMRESLGIPSSLVALLNII